MYSQQRDLYKKTDGDYYEESEDAEGVIVDSLGWRIWLTIAFAIAGIIAIIVMLAVLLNSNVSKVSNQDLKEEIQKQCNPYYRHRDSSGSDEDSHDHDKGHKKHSGGGDKKCEDEFGHYMTTRFDYLFHSGGSTHYDWDKEWKDSECSQSEARHAFDQRMNYLTTQWKPAEEWGIKDFRDYMNDKLDWLGERISLVSVQNENKNENNNDVDIFIENDNKIEVDIKNTVNTAVARLTVMLNDIAEQMDELEQFLSLQKAASIPDGTLLGLIDSRFDELEELLLNQPKQLKGNSDESDAEEPSPVPTILDTAQFWPSSGADQENTKYSPDMEQQPFTPTTTQLIKRWSYDTRGSVGSSATPTTDGSLLFSTDFGGDVFALEHDTGALVWKRSLNDILGVPESSGGLIVSRNSPVLASGCGRRKGKSCVLIGAPGDRGASGFPQTGGIMYTGPAHMIALDAATGETLWVSPALDTHPWSQLTASVSVAEGKVYGGIHSLEIMAPLVDSSYPCCSFRGSAFALAIETGELLWQTYTIPEQSGKNTRNKKGAYAGVGIKGSNPPVDTDAHLVYFATSQFSMIPDSVGACLRDQKKNGVYPGESNFRCLDDNLYPASILALDMDTGAIVISHITYGVNAWNPVCIRKPGDRNCPQPSGYDHAFSQSPVLHEVEGEKRVLAMQRSGVVWSLAAADGAFRWSRHLPSGQLGGGSWGCAYDKVQSGFVCAVTGAPEVFLGSPRPVSYSLADGSIACDASWWFLDAQTGAVQWQTLSPYARPSKQCPPLIPNAFIQGMRLEGVNGKAPVSPSRTARVGKSCAPPSTGSVLESSEFARSYGSPAIGGGVAYVTEMSGHLYGLYTANGDCVGSARCEQGGIYGGASLSRVNGLELLTIGCGYGRLQEEWEKHAGCGDGSCSVIAFAL